MKNFFATNKGIIIVGTTIGIIATLLQYLGNPANMGICVACFTRDIAGAIGLHSAAPVQYIRPELVGLILGAFIISMIKKEFRPRGGSSSLIRFFLGVFAMIGALVFLGCPWRAILRLAGGDGNAAIGLAGLISGIFVGVQFLKKGYNLGRTIKSNNKVSGIIMPLFMLALFLLMIFDFSKITLSVKGPGSLHAPIVISLIAGLIIGWLAQRSRFCTMGSFRDIFVIKDFHLFFGVIAMLLVALVMNLFWGQFKPGFGGQPVAIWNFFGMVLSGLAFSLSGGCPGRQYILAGEGDSDAGVFIIGMLVGAGFAHNFGLASSPKSVGVFGPIAVVVGIIFCLTIGYLMIEKRKTAK